jgi:hypothetical protein
MQQWYQCPSCEAPVAFGVKFCSNCGTRLNWPTQQQVPIPSAYQQSQQTPVPKKVGKNVPKNCPLEQWLSTELLNRPDRCELCDFYRDGKCRHKEILDQTERNCMRGLPVLTKRGAMNKPKEVRRQLEQAALQYSGLDKKEQEEYWSVSQRYDAFWDVATPDQRQGILQCLNDWRAYLEAGCSPLEANEKVIDRVNSHAEK